ncbi:MarR family winged helix-turn-helix transcriptional regulator [Lysobacter sp. cf310]|uniref:MarR family winged helix-turn-helix transcriptional regulator n=1 Tax=Lysobacter sp. cf310 TaxID=1761790 RepID=UPI0008F372C2|nr:MarR family transcriptional regulator [Lysobacter sp. cf310]SFK53350.1 DNA-binding transcriptional regulator, MarR family [Lysobacter sp. cf310]
MIKTSANAPSDNPLRLIGQVNRAFARIVDGPLRELGFAIGQLPVLVSLKKVEALSQAELARLAQVEQPSMAQLLNRMERDGWVRRVPDPNDKRSRLISLTDRASERMPRAKAVMDATSRQALAGFSAKEKEQLAALLLRVNANLDRIP